MKYCRLLAICICLYTSAFAQPKQYEISETSIVKDSGGTVYPFNVWRTLVQQGDYELRAVSNPAQQVFFLLVKLNEEEKNTRLESMPKPRETGSFKTGKDFAFFKASDINNNKVDLKELKGKVIVLNFWFVNCPPCRMEIPALNELVTSYQGNNSIKFIGVALDAKSELQNFLKQFPFKYTVVYNGRFLARRYGVEGYPTHVIIDQEGKVYFHTMGLATNTVYWIRKSINELLARSAVSRN